MSMEIQNMIRKNAMEMRQTVSDLYEWQQEIELKEKAKAKLRQGQRQKDEQAFKKAKQEQIRMNKINDEIQSKIAKVEKEQRRKADLVRDANSIKDYYNAWDKFDADKVLKKFEEEEEKAYRPYNPYEDSKNNLRAKPKTKINVSGRRNVVIDPSELKDRGNLHFQSLEYDKAIECYTECLKRLDAQNILFEDMTADRKKLYCVVLSNRSMTNLKNQNTSKALEDATESLKYNSKYAKSYYRRGECLKKLGKYRQSVRDFKMVMALEPGQTKAQSQIKKIQAFLSRRARQTRESMLIDYNQNMMMGSKRIEIDEVAEFQCEQKKEGSNYFQEL